MVMKAKTIAAGQFKAKCLALLDEVVEHAESFVITKRGRPVARVVPIEESDEGPRYARPGAGGDVFARARAAAGTFVDEQGAADVATEHDRYLAETWGRS